MSLAWTSGPNRRAPCSSTSPTGASSASEVYKYRNGVIDERLPAPDEDVILGPDWALQDPNDYIETFKRAIPGVVAGQAGIDPAEVIGIGIDFTACTMLPTKADGTPLCFLDEYRRDPHAWVKLWKHHAAQPEADDVNRVARETGRAWLARYGGKISSEWFFPKALQILREAPGDIPRGRSPDRGRRLGHLAAHRRRDPQQLHGRLQGDLVGRGGLPRRRASSRLSIPSSPTSSTTRCAGPSPAWATPPAG